MNIRSIILPAIALVSASYSASADMAPARLLAKDGANKDVVVLTYKSGFYTYKVKAVAITEEKIGPSKLDGVYFYEPPVFREAMSLYQGRKYTEAKKKFAECEESFKNVNDAPGNYSTLAGFYKMECSRRMMDLASLSAELEKFRKGGLVREMQLQQLEVYAFWEAVRLKEWERLDRLAKAWAKRLVPADQRAQIAYCHGLALEELAKANPKKARGLENDALNAYNRAMTADASASIELVIAAANNSFRIYDNDPKVKDAIALWKKEGEKKNSSGHIRLLEANALARLYQLSGLDKVKALDLEYAKFLKFKGEL